MNVRLKTKSLTFLITQRCSLNCKYCGALVPHYKTKHHVPYEIVCREVEQIFKIYDYIEILGITGGEPLLHPQLNEILKFILKNYIKNIGNLRITTNGTITLNEDIIKTLSQNPKVSIKIDQYGTNSFAVDELVKQCAENKINHRVVPYCEDEQYFGGWVDFGDFEYQNYTEAQLNKVFKTCHSAHQSCLVVRFGKLYLCTPALAAAELKKYEVTEGEIIDLFDMNFSQEHAISKVEKLGTVPIEACKYCRGFDIENSPRVNAGEQI